MAEERKKRRKKSAAWDGQGMSLPSLFDDETQAPVGPPVVPDLPSTSLEWLGSKDDERRQQPRAAVEAGVRVTINGYEFAARSVDISKGGISFHPVPYWVRMNDPVLIEFGEPLQRVLGRVAWMKAVDDDSGNLTIGVRFSRQFEEEPSVEFFRNDST